MFLNKSFQSGRICSSVTSVLAELKMEESEDGEGIGFHWYFRKDIGEINQANPKPSLSLHY